MRFFVGMHQPSSARYVGPAFISINRLRDRKRAFEVGDWIMDSGAFTSIAKHGGYPEAPEVYATQIKRWSTNGNLLAAVAQDYMCEPHMLERTGLTVQEHQRLTIQRYDALTDCDTGGIYVMPVLQGYSAGEYLDHLRMYGDRLPHGAWVGVGSVCKRNGDPMAIVMVLSAIKHARPDLRLHGFGLKTTALHRSAVRALLHTADSMSWSFAARKQGRNANDPREAASYQDMIQRYDPQPDLLTLMVA